MEECYYKLLGREGKVIASELTHDQMRVFAERLIKNYAPTGDISDCIAAVADGIFDEHRACYSFAWITKSGHMVVLEQIYGNRKIIVGTDRSYKFYNEIGKLVKLAKCY